MRTREKWEKGLFSGISLQIRSLAAAALTLGKKKAASA